MFQNMQVTNQPLFYLFIAVSLLLSLGYVWGKRRNTRIYLSAFNAVVDFLKPKDQSFTNIGGLTGYHANLIPKKNKTIRRVDLTLTMLPRQSWLYLPFSLLLTRGDRLFVTLLFGKKIDPDFKEGHLIEEKYSRTGRGRIDNPKEFDSQEFLWGQRNYILYTKDEYLKEAFKELIKKIPDPLTLKHVAIVPQDSKAYFYMVPKLGTVRNIFASLFGWITATVEYAEKLQS